MAVVKKSGEVWDKARLCKGRFCGYAAVHTRKLRENGCISGGSSSTALGRTAGKKEAERGRTIGNLV